MKNKSEARPVMQKKNNLPSGLCFSLQSSFLKWKLRHLKYELLEDPPYSPDLASSNVLLIPNLNNFWAGKRYGSNTVAEAVMGGDYAGFPKYQSNG